MTLVEKIMEKIKGKEIDDDAPPREIRDRYLESLRRERQVQLNEDEKEYLKQRIAQVKKEKVKRYMFGIKDKPERKESILKRAKYRKQNNILKQKSILDNRKKEFKRTKRIKL